MEPERTSRGTPAVGTPAHPARIGIDARPLRWPGIGRYTSELIEHLARVDTVDHFFVYCETEAVAARFRGRWPNLEAAVLGSGLYTIGEQLRLSLRIRADALDLFHAPASLVVPLVRSCPLVVTVHDLLLRNHPDHLPSPLARLYFGLMNAAALRGARQLLTVSDFTRSELAAAYPTLAARTRTTPNAVGSDFRPTANEPGAAALRAAVGAHLPYFLYVGTYKKHKNLPFLVEAYAGLPPALRAGCQLVLLARRDPRYPEVDELIERHRLRDSVLQIDRVEEDALIALYGGALAVVAPSIYEGFGFPVLEGMACGTAVVATDIPAFVEVAGDCALYAAPGDRPALTAALVRLLQEPALREQLAAAGLARSRRFSWHRTALDTLAAYRAALGSPATA